MAVRHDELTEGLWYLRTDYQPFYTVVSITRMVIGPNAGELWVFMFDHEGGVEIAAFDDDQFIGPVPAPA